MVVKVEVYEDPLAPLFKKKESVEIDQEKVTRRAVRKELKSFAWQGLVRLFFLGLAWVFGRAGLAVVMFQEWNMFVAYAACLIITATCFITAFFVPWPEPGEE